MGTRSAIVVHDGHHQNYRGIYCHWDGYPEYNGMILLEHYTDPNKVSELMALGNLSSLGDNIGEKHAFDNRDETVCTAYFRDRGEEDQEALEFGSLDEIFDHYNHVGCEYVYIFHPNDYEDWACYEIDSRKYINLYDVKQRQEAVSG